MKSLTFVTSRLDNINFLCYDISDCLLTKLQKGQNNAARLILRAKNSSHITLILMALRWLPVKFRLEYKILTLVFKCLYGQNSIYISTYIGLCQEWNEKLQKHPKYFKILQMIIFFRLIQLLLISRTHSSDEFVSQYLMRKKLLFKSDRNLKNDYICIVWLRI